jgi:hypothetical protein
MTPTDSPLADAPFRLMPAVPAARFSRVLFSPTHLIDTAVAEVAVAQHFGTPVPVQRLETLDGMAILLRNGLRICLLPARQMQLTVG